MTNGNGNGWKNAVIGILAALLVAGVGAITTVDLFLATHIDEKLDLHEKVEVHPVQGARFAAHLDDFEEMNAEVKALRRDMRTLLLSQGLTPTED